MMSVTVIDNGFSAAVQDLGRPGFQRFGVIVGGVMDSPSAKLANWLVGNTDHMALIEFSFLGPALRFEEATLFAVTGAFCQPHLDDHVIGINRPIAARKGQVLTIGGLISGARGYIAISGGIDTKPWLNSRSTYERAGCGGFCGRHLEAGDCLPIGSVTDLQQRLIDNLLSRESLVTWLASLRRNYKRPAVIRFMRDYHWPLFTEESRAFFRETNYVVTRESDRIGYRLAGKPIKLKMKQDIYSEAVAFGSVQVPPNGQPIILMADHQSTGGYPRIAHVARVDLPLLSQLPPGSRLRFDELSVTDAEKLFLKRASELDYLHHSVSRKLATLAE